MNFLENSGFDIGMVNGTTGLTATNAYLSSTATVTQSAALTRLTYCSLAQAGVYKPDQHR